MEHEVRFYYNKNEYEKIINLLKEIPELHSNLKLYEHTIQYNHPRVSIHTRDSCPFSSRTSFSR